MERNNLIDGWRGWSVGLVIIGHLVGFRFRETFEAQPFRSLLHADALTLVQQVSLRLLVPLPSIGVNIFFVISGFLITSLLLREEGCRGRVSISAFYARRLFRIVPAFATYLATIFALTLNGVIDVPIPALVTSGCFLCNFPGANCTWWLAHTWSLAVEEQYYLAWPLLFVIVGRWRTIALAGLLLALLLISPIWPLALSFAHIAIGGLYAASKNARVVIDRMQGAAPLFIAIVFLHPFSASLFPVNAAIAAAGPIMLATVFFASLRGNSAIAPLIAIEPMRRLGLLSYSVYLWQQLSTGPANYHANTLLAFPLLFVVPAVVSYFVVERPCIRVGHLLSTALMTGRGVGMYSK